MDEKAKLVTNDNFYMISDERNSSRINLNKQPDRTLSSFLLESQFYENLQIVRWVVKSLFVIVWFQTYNTAQRRFFRPSKKTTWSQTWDLTRRGGDLPSSQPLRIPCLILSIPISEPPGNHPVCINIYFCSWLDMIWGMLISIQFPDVLRCLSQIPSDLMSLSPMIGSMETGRRQGNQTLCSYVFNFPSQIESLINMYLVRNLMTLVSERATHPTPRRTSPCSWTCTKRTWRWSADAGLSGDDVIFLF